MIEAKVWPSWPVEPERQNVGIGASGFSGSSSTSMSHFRPVSWSLAGTMSRIYGNAWNALTFGR